MLCGLLAISGCAVGKAPPTSARPSSDVEAIDATKQFWSVYTSVLASGDIEPLASVCERESLAWINARSKLLEDQYNGIVTVTTSLNLSNFTVRMTDRKTIVTHKLDQKGYEASPTTKKPLESEQTLPSARETVVLERLGAKLLVTKWDTARWS